MESDSDQSRGEQEWRNKLTPEQYHVLREKGTEAPFSGKYYEDKSKGMYVCAACGNELFSSDTKYDSGSGWPSFVEPARAEAVRMEPDTSLGIERTEIICNRCGSHLGHVFDDGPDQLPDGRPASGQRFCVNSLALDLKPAGEEDTNL